MLSEHSSLAITLEYFQEANTVNAKWSSAANNACNGPLHLPLKNTCSIARIINVLGTPDVPMIQSKLPSCINKDMLPFNKKKKKHIKLLAIYIVIPSLCPGT